MKNNVFGSDENYISFIIIIVKLVVNINYINTYVYYAFYIHLIIHKIMFDECHD